MPCILLDNACLYFQPDYEEKENLQEQQLVVIARLSESQRTKPMFATSERYGVASDGKICSVNPGIRPRAVGPKRMPPKTSAMTLGCFNLRRSKLKSCAVMMIRPSCGVRHAPAHGEDHDTYQLE